MVLVICVLTNPSGDSDAHSSLRSTGLEEGEIVEPVPKLPSNENFLLEVQNVAACSCHELVNILNISHNSGSQ